jgi:sialidase-1
VPYIWLVASLWLPKVEARGAHPFFATQELFTATSTNYYHIPGLAVTAKGTVLAYAAWRDVDAKDWGKIYIVMRRSTDGGKTWGPEHQVAPGNLSVDPVVRTSPPKVKGHETDLVVDNAMVIPDLNGKVHFVFCVDYRRVFYMRSADDGVTWSRPMEISKVFEAYRPEMDWKIVATGPGHGIQLRNHRLIIPSWLATGGTEGFQHRPSMTVVIYSDDHGSTWKAGDIVAKTTGRGDDPQVYHDPNETSAVELGDGDVLLNIRAPSARHRRLQSVSADGATGWSKPEFVEDLPEPIVFGSIVRMPDAQESDRNTLLFSIDTGTEITKKAKAFDEQGFKREDMTVFVSNDDGKRWPIKKVIQAGPCGCGYSDLAVLQDGTILCAFGSGPHFGSGAGIRLARFNLAWVLEKREAAKR